MKPRYFDLAKKLSVKSTHPKHQLGCVIVNKNRIVGVGFNKFKTHTRSNHAFQMLHAEVDALIGQDRSVLRGCDVYVYRETKDGQPAMSKPCQACELALRDAGIKTVYYTTEGGFETFRLQEQ